MKALQAKKPGQSPGNEISLTPWFTLTSWILRLVHTAYPHGLLQLTCTHKFTYWQTVWIFSWETNGSCTGTF